MTGDPSDTWVGDDRFAHIAAAELEAARSAARGAETYAPVPVYDFHHEARQLGTMAAHKHYKEGVERRTAFMALMSEGQTVQGALENLGLSYETYKTWRRKYKPWAARVDELRAWVAMGSDVPSGIMDIAHFCGRFFGQVPSWFQLQFLRELEQLPNGNILLVLWPPEHGKTSTFENFSNFKLAFDASWRALVASENQGIAKKILGRVMDRMHPLGPSRDYVQAFGPFIPQTGGGLAQVRQPWTDSKFRVYGAREFDERNYSMEAVGAGGSIVSARCDHLHVDDPQSTKTLAQTDRLVTWFRQDALSRPAESGKTSVCGTRVGDGDFFENLLDDTNLEGIMKVIRFPAVITDNATGEQKPLWEKRTPDGPGHTLDSLDRMRRKVGEDIWDRNWMQNPGLSRKGKGTFTRQAVEPCRDPDRSLEHHVGDEGDRDGAIVYIGLDPALGGKNCVMACEVLPEDLGSKLVIRRIREDIGFERNEQIMASLESVIRWCELSGNVTDVVIEDKNFQLGLKNDERLSEMSRKHGFSIRGHTTGWSKYDPDIGVASMATSFIKGEIVLPWAEDRLTRHEIGELERQLYAWRPGIKGNKLRQDRVMALWFVWMLWRSRSKSLNGVGSTDNRGFTRQTTDWRMTSTGLVVPNRGAA